MEKGYSLNVFIRPIGDAYTNPNDEINIKLITLGGIYYIELCRSEIVVRKELLKEEAINVVEYFNAWKSYRLKGAEMSYSKVNISIGRWKRNFKSNFNYGEVILKKYLDFATDK